MTNATYQGRAYRVIGDDGMDMVQLEDWATGTIQWLPYGAVGLVIDPTDEQFFACVNVQEDPDA